jgi:hypothetical protein
LVNGPESHIKSKLDLWLIGVLALLVVVFVTLILWLISFAPRVLFYIVLIAGVTIVLPYFIGALIERLA